MKPEDIMNAIGDVDERFVKQAHRRDLVKAVAVFLLAFVILVIPIGSVMIQEYILTRLNPDFSVNTGYVNPDALNAKWTIFEYIGENGTTTFRRTLFGGYRVIYTGANGETEYLWGRGDRDYLNGTSEEYVYLSYIYSEQASGKLKGLMLYQEDASYEEPPIVNWLGFEYNDFGQLTVEYRYEPDGPGMKTLGYRTFSYANGFVIGTKDYDAQDNLLAYSETTVTDNRFETVYCEADGTVTGTATGRIDWFGRVTERKTYDVDGNLVGTEIYHYRLLERFLSIGGLIALSFVVGMSLLAAFTVYDDRIVLSVKKKTEVPASKPKPTPKPVVRLAEEKAQEQAADQHAKSMVILGVVVFLAALAITFYIDGVAMCPYPSEAWEDQQALIQSVSGYEDAALVDIYDEDRPLTILTSAEMDGKLHLFLFVSHPFTGRRALIDTEVVDLDYTGSVQLGEGRVNGRYELKDGKICFRGDSDGDAVLCASTYLLIGLAGTLIVVLAYHGVYCLLKKKKHNG